MNYLQFLLLGTGNGAVFAALALALVVTYRSSGVINFGSSAIALVTAYTYAYLREGKLLLLVPGLPDTVDLGGSLAFVPAALIALVVAALLGLVLFVLVFRPLRTSPPVAKAVAALGIMVLAQAVVAQRLGSNPITVDPIFPSKVYSLGKLKVPGDRLWFAATIIVVALLIAAAYRFTRFGLATRAAAETERGAVVSGISPDRIAAYNWMIGGVVAGLAGILIAPIVPLVPVSYTLFIVPALAAAVIGRFTSLSLGVAAGLVIGMLQSEMQLLQGKYTWLPQSGLPELVPLVLIILFLVVRARPLPDRGSIIQQNLGRAPRPRVLLVPTVAGVAIATIGIFALHGSWRAALIMSMIMAIISLSLVVVTGYAGQVSLAQLTLAGGAGFLLTNFSSDLGVPFPIAPILAALGAAIIGGLLGLPAIRVRGLTVAVVTLAIAVAIEAFWFRNSDLNGGYKGANVKQPSLFGIDLGIGSGSSFPRPAFAFTVLVILVLVALGVAKLRTSRLGSAMLAVRANERAAAAAGINVVRVKLLGFVIGAFIAGIGGSMLTYRQGTVTYESFTVVVGLSLFATTYLSGITSVLGGINAGIIGSGGLVFVALDRWVSVGDWYEAIMGVLLVLTVVRNPEGIVGGAHALADRFWARRAAAKPGEPVDPAEVDVVADATTPADVVASAADLRTAEPAAASGEPGAVLLSLAGVGVSYGGVVAVSNVSFDIAEGSIVGLIGPNGAGKTTLIDAISGFTTATGSVSLGGRGLDGLPPHQRIRAGMGRTFQAIELYDDLSVEENVSVGLSGHRVSDGRESLDRVLHLLGLRALRNRPAGDLSQGQRQLVSIARALVGRPRMLLLDEPAAGLDTTESQWLAERLRLVRGAGVTILMIDHDMDLVLGLCDEIHVLNFGELVASGPPSAIRADRRVAAAYLGSGGGGTDEAATDSDETTGVAVAAPTGAS